MSEGRSDASPLDVDKTISWDSIGGLDTHIHSVKEMVVLPLLYPQVRASCICVCAVADAVLH
jgi:ATP-dependent 26S proteasome regulatory subunit